MATVGPGNAMTIPNLLSLFRMGLIPLFVIAVLEHEPLRALLIFVVAGITDAADGILARVLKQQSLLGMYLDPMADKLLLVSAYVLLSMSGAHQGVLIPLWVTVLVLARDVLIVVIALILHLTASLTRFPPTWVSKVNTVSQIACVLLVLLSGISPLFTRPAQFAVVAVGFSTLVSGLDYLLRVHRMAGSSALPPEPRER